MESLAQQSEDIIDKFVDIAISQSETFAEAIGYVQQNASLTIHGQAIKKAIQDEITKRALESNCY